MKRNKLTIKKVLVWMLALPIMVLSFEAGAAEGFLKRGLDLFRGVTSKEEPAEALAALTSDDISAGLKEALRVGSEKVVDQLGASDGFNGDSLIHIPLPEQMDRVRSALARVGMDGTFNDLETSLNRAAEEATPVAKELFVNAVADMTLEDVNSIFRGENDAATQYFRTNMSPALNRQMQPIVQSSLADVGAVRLFDQIMDRYNSLPLVPRMELDLNAYVTDKAMDGIFFYLAREEAAIRENPVARTTDLLKKVFAQ